MNPLISVIVPVYKSEKYLSKCIDSIINQTYRNLEIILVDDGSPDNCSHICDDYASKDSRIKVIHKDNEGQAIARNVALDVSQGEYISFIDSDDYIDESLYSNLMSKAPFEVCIFGCTYSDDKGNNSKNKIQLEKNFITWKDDCDVFERLIKESLFGYACNKIYNRKTIDNKRYKNIKLREDTVFNIEVLNDVSKIYISDECGYYYCQHSDSTLKGTYNGNVPNIMYVAKQLSTLNDKLDAKINLKLSSFLVLTYLIDSIQKYIFYNQALNENDKIEELKNIFNDRELKNKLTAQYEKNVLFKLIDVCYKLNLPKLFYEIMKRRWHCG